MKKIIGILSAFLLLGFVVCLIVGLSMGVPVQVPAGSVVAYKFCNVFEYFFMFLPAMLITGVVVSYSVHFGHNSEGSVSPFSKAMIGRYKIIMIVGLVCSFVLTLSNETFGILVQQRKNTIINKPKVIQEYIKVGNNLYENGLYERSMRYADAALKLEPNSGAARDLKSRNDIEINRQYTNNLKFDLTSAQPLVVEDKSLIIDTEKMADAYKCYVTAQKAYDNKEWFNAHYYAELGIKLASPKDPNQEALQSLSARAWNNLTEIYESTRTQEQNLFEQKYKGYLALTEQDDLQAYYIFRHLHENYTEMQRDPDINFYLDIAQNRVEQRYFFVDETFELKSFENANDVYFSFKHADGSCDIVYFKGMTSVKATGQAIQYLRDFSIVTMNRNGQWVRTMNVPYAKLMPVSVKSLSSITKSMLEIDDKTNYVPYILLKSVGRDNPELSYGPTYTYADGQVVTIPEYMIFPLSYNDFLMLEETPADPKTISVISLFKLISKCKDYGYSQELFSEILLNRILYPLFLLILFVFLGAFGWNNRIGSNQYFKFGWVFSFPLIIIVSLFGYKLAFFLFSLINYFLMGVLGCMGGLWTGFGLYIVVLILMSIYFLSRSTKK